jgi:hypothetical protein
MIRVFSRGAVFVRSRRKASDPPALNALPSPYFIFIFGKVSFRVEGWILFGFGCDFRWARVSATL